MQAVMVYRVDYAKKTKDPLVSYWRCEKRSGCPITTTCCGWHGGTSRWMWRTPSTLTSMLVKPVGDTAQRTRGGLAG
jgi:hypothetical protein